MAKNRIVKILMERDGITEEEARELVEDTSESVNEAIAMGDCVEAEAIFTSELGLEPDYLIDLL